MTASLRACQGGWTSNPEVRYHTSLHRHMPCTEGRVAHAWSGKACQRCGIDRSESDLKCWSYECGDTAYEVVDRWVLDVPNSYALVRGERITQKLITDTGGCDWCHERRRREDAKRQRDADREITEARYIGDYRRRQAERDAARAAKEEQWQLAKHQRTERQRQRQELRRGHRTLIELRSLLRTGAGRSQQPESRPAKSSPTS